MLLAEVICMFARVLLNVAVAWLLLLFGVLVPLRTCAWPESECQLPLA